MTILERASLQLRKEQIKKELESPSLGFMETIKGVYDSVVGSLPSKEKRWVIDLDADVLEKQNIIEEEINSLDPIGNKILAKIPTKSGLHLITSPFRSDLYELWCKENNINTDIQKLNPTILYLGKSLMNN